MTKRIISKILPDETIDRLHFLGQVVSDANWEIGDITALTCQALDAAKAAVACETSKLSQAEISELFQTGHMDVYAKISAETGISRRSISNYLSAAKFYPPEVREEFDVLPFSHFMLAMSFGGDWRKVLELSVRQMDYNNGNPPSVDWLEMNANRTEIAQTGMDVADAAQGAYYTSPEYDIQPPETEEQPEITPATRFALDRISHAARAIQKLTDNLEADSGFIGSLKAIIQNLIDLIEKETIK